MDGRRADASRAETSRAESSRAEANRSQAKGAQQAEPAPDTHKVGSAERAGKADKARPRESEEASKLNAPDAALGLLDWRGLKTEANAASAGSERVNDPLTEIRTKQASTASDGEPGLEATQAGLVTDNSGHAVTQGAEKPGRVQVAEQADGRNGSSPELQDLQALGTSRAVNGSQGISGTQGLTEVRGSQDLESLRALQTLQGSADSQAPTSANASAPSSSLPSAPSSTALSSALGAAGPSNNLQPLSGRAGVRLAAASGATAPTTGRAAAVAGLTGKSAASAASSASVSASSTESSASNASSTSATQTATGLVTVGARTGSAGNNAGSDSSLFSATLNAAPAAAEPAAGNTISTANTQPSGPFSAQLEPEVGSPAWHQALSQQVMHMRAGEVNEAQLQLNPAGLGPLRIKLSLCDQQLDAEFSAAHAQVRAALEAALPQLREALQQGGMQLGQASVEPSNAQTTPGNMGNMNDRGRPAYGQAAQDGSGGSRETARASLAGLASLSGSASSAPSVLAGVTGGHGPGQRLNTFA